MISSGMYVILFDGNPYLKDGGAVRKYLTRERAEKEARKLMRYLYYRTRRAQVAEMTFDNIEDITEVDA